MKKKTVILVSIAVLLTVGSITCRLISPGLQFVLNNMEKDDTPCPAPLCDTAIILGGDTVPIRVYRPHSKQKKVVLLVHGVHFKGYNEPRLLHFMRTLLTEHSTVVVPDLHDLKNYELTPHTVGLIEQCALWTINSPRVNPRHKKIALYGISFSGGLCISVASRESLRGRISSVFDFGGHGDLDETLEYLVTGIQPDGTRLPPHIYAGAVVARWLADSLVPPGQVQPLREALFYYLSEQGDNVDRMLDSLPEESKMIVNLCRDRKADELGKLLKIHLKNYTADPVLSPLKGPVPTSPLFLLHGSTDNVIPPAETRKIGVWAAQTTRVVMLVSPLIQHVEMGKNSRVPPVADYWNFIRFWTELLRS